MINIVASEPEANELNGNTNDGGGGMIIVKASEPKGEGAVDFVLGNIDNDGIGGGGCSF